MPAVPRHGAHRLAPGGLGVDRHVPVVRGHGPGHPRPRRPGRAPRRRRSAPGRRRLAKTVLDEGPKWARRRLSAARARRCANRMPTLARLLALEHHDGPGRRSWPRPPPRRPRCRCHTTRSRSLGTPERRRRRGRRHARHHRDGAQRRRRRRSPGSRPRSSSQTPGVTITQGSSSYPDIAAGASAANTTPLQVTLDPTLACGTTLDFTLTVTNADGTRRRAVHRRHRGRRARSRTTSGSPAVIGELRRQPAPGGWPRRATRPRRSVPDHGIVDEVRVYIGSITHPDISHLSPRAQGPRRPHHRAAGERRSRRSAAGASPAPSSCRTGGDEPRSAGHRALHRECSRPTATSARWRARPAGRPGGSSPAEPDPSARSAGSTAGSCGSRRPAARRDRWRSSRRRPTPSTPAPTSTSTPRARAPSTSAASRATSGTSSTATARSPTDPATRRDELRRAGGAPSSVRVSDANGVDRHRVDRPHRQPPAQRGHRPAPGAKEQTSRDARRHRAPTTSPTAARSRATSGTSTATTTSTTTRARSPASTSPIPAATRSSCA